MPSVSSVRLSCVGSFRVGCSDSASRLSYGMTRGEAGKSGAPQLTSTTSTPSSTSILTDTSVHHAYLMLSLIHI